MAKKPLKTPMTIEDNRRRFPQTAHLVDQFRTVFGNDQITVIYCEEGENKAGKTPVNPDKLIQPTPDYYGLSQG